MPFAGILAVSVRETSEHFNNRPTGSLTESWYLIVVVAGIVILWVALYWWDRVRRRPVRREATPHSLFRDLCDIHELSRTERSLLEQLVESHCPEHPAVVFVVPRLLRDMARADQPHAADCDRLAKKLFGEPVGELRVES